MDITLDKNTKDLLDKLNINYINDKLISDDVIPLSRYLLENKHNTYHVDITIGAAADFITQVSYYENLGYTFYNISEDDIYVIDKSRFFISSKNLSKINENYIIIQEPYKKNNKYLSPELKNNDSLPLIVRKTSCYYNLGMALIEIAFKTLNKEALREIQFLPLFYCIKRCIEENPNHRYLLYI